MELAEVIGSVTATIKAESLGAQKLLLVRSLGAGAEGADAARVAIDTVGAGPGDRVLLTVGSAARQPPSTRSVATDLSIVAIVDSVDLSDAGSKGKQTKSSESKRSRK